MVTLINGYILELIIGFYIYLWFNILFHSCDNQIGIYMFNCLHSRTLSSKQILCRHVIIVKPWQQEKVPSPV